jgi:tellurite resistance protein
MPWSFHKAFQKGPLRLNLSKSGLGLSLGVRGFRVGVDARGQAYLRAGHGGISYRQNLGALGRPSLAPRSAEPDGIEPDRTHMELIEDDPLAGGPSRRHEASGHNPLVADELTSAIHKAVETKPLLAWGATVCLLLGGAGILALWYAFSGKASTLGSLGGILAGLGAWGAGAACVYFAFRRDQARKLKLEFEFDNDAWIRWLAFCNSIGALARTTTKVQSPRGRFGQSKFFGGPAEAIEAHSVEIERNRPLNFVDTNIALPAIGPINGTTYQFLPDRILRISDGRMGNIAYSELNLELDETTVVESSVPRDGRLVGQTWQHTRLDGGPDRRFSYNPQLPIIGYSIVKLTAAGRMDYTFLIASESAAKQFFEELSDRARVQDVTVRRLEPTAKPADEAEEAPVEPPSNAASAEPDSGMRTPAQMVFDLVLEALCCMVYADGKATSGERDKVQALLVRLHAPWAPDEIARRMQAFRARGRTESFTQVLEETCQRLRRIEEPKQQQVLQKCLQAVAQADGVIEERERQVFRQLMRSFSEIAV